MKMQKGFIGLTLLSGVYALAAIAFSASLGMLADGTIKPVAGYEESCQAQSVNSANGNYSYASTDHCAKK